MTINKWGALASFLLAISFIVAPLIYLMGNLRDAIGVFAYDLADFLYGPILSASLIIMIYVLRERIGKSAFRRMDLALLSAVLSAAGMAAVAFIRASNRHYHLIHPELNLENSTTVLIVWTTLVAGVSALGFHFLGWTFVLLGSAGWTSRLSPRLLSAVFFSGRSLGLVCLSVSRTRRTGFVAWHDYRYLARNFVLETGLSPRRPGGLKKRVIKGTSPLKTARDKRVRWGFKRLCVRELSNRAGSNFGPRKLLPRSNITFFEYFSMVWPSIT
jgi:hypothetical protein